MKTKSKKGTGFFMMLVVVLSAGAMILSYKITNSDRAIIYVGILILISLCAFIRFNQNENQIK